LRLEGQLVMRGGMTMSMDLSTVSRNFATDTGCASGHKVWWSSCVLAFPAQSPPNQAARAPA
jgi:hypothetical protein